MVNFFFSCYTLLKIEQRLLHLRYCACVMFVLSSIRTAITFQALFPPTSRKLSLYSEASRYNVRMQSVHHRRQHVRQGEVNGWEKGGNYNDLQAHYGRGFKGMSLMIIAM